MTIETVKAYKNNGEYGAWLTEDVDSIIRSKRSEVLKKYLHAPREVPFWTPTGGRTWKKETKHFQDGYRRGYSDATDHASHDFRRNFLTFAEDILREFAKIDADIAAAKKEKN